MKAVILAGGLGTRLSEETKNKPKPMVSIGEHPILWHIIQIYARQGVRDFIVAGGYKHEIISNWVDQCYIAKDPWIRDLNIKIKNTGAESLTGLRILRCMEEIDEDLFFCTYGDGVANVNLRNLLDFHNSHGKLSSLTVVRPPARFGHVSLSGDSVMSFDEKNQADEGWINGGYFVLNREISNYFSEQNEAFEKGALPRLAGANQLMAYKHTGFWRPMDTIRDREDLKAITLHENQIPWFEV